MVKVLFVCLGNICRSPMAEYILKKIIKEKGLEGKISVNSAATSSSTLGLDMHEESKMKLDEKNVSYKKHRAKKIKPSDYKNYDYIIGMDESNITNIIKITGNDIDKKIYKLMDFTDTKRDIADPWYTGNFSKAYDDIEYGCKKLLEFIIKKYNL